MNEKELAKAIVVQGKTKKSLPRMLMAIRLQLGMSQEAFAERVGLSQTTMARIESGEEPVTLQLLEQITSAIGATISFTDVHVKK